jgi:Protein of unknown function (DUF3467)
MGNDVLTGNSQKGDRFMAEEMKKFGETPPAQAPGQAAPQFNVDTTGMSAAYANFCRVTGTPEELVLDFGLNTQMTPVPTEPVKLTHRLVMNYYTAKRLLGALHMAVQQHENTYGVLETDIQKRVRQGAQGRLGAGQPPR